MKLYPYVSKTKAPRRTPARPLLKRHFYALGGYANPDLFTRQAKNGARRYYME